MGKDLMHEDIQHDAGTVTTTYRETIGALAGDPAELEQVYQEARNSGEMDAFKEAIDDRYHAAPDNLL
jgi:hypothetical protein